MAPWQYIPQPPSRAPLRVGVLALSSDCGPEAEFPIFLKHWLAFPASGKLPLAIMMTARMDNGDTTTLETLKSMAAVMQASAMSIYPYQDEACKTLDVLIFGCTSGSLAIGESEVERLITTSKPCKTVIQVSASIRDALNALGAKKIAVLTPYVDEVNVTVDKFMASMGVEVVACASFGCPTDFEINAVTPGALMDAGVKLVRSAPQTVDALFISCTALLVSTRLAAMETELG